MTKKQYNDDALYQEIMASLEPGAAEYDRMMTSGEAPAKRKRVSSLVWYAAAAAVVGLLVVTATLFVDNEEERKNVANTDSTISRERHLSAKQKPTTLSADEGSNLDKPTPKTESVQKQTDSMSSSNEAIYTAKLPEVIFSTIYNDSTPHQNSTGMAVTQDETE